MHFGRRWLLYKKKVEEMCRDYLTWKQIRANGDMAVRQGLARDT